MAHRRRTSRVREPSMRTILFNDVVEEESSQLRHMMFKFLKVYSYSRFDIEFTSFRRRMQLLIQDGQRNNRNCRNLSKLAHHLMLLSSHHVAPPSSVPTVESSSQITANHQQHAEPTNSLDVPPAEPTNSLDVPPAEPTNSLDVPPAEILTLPQTSNNIHNKPMNVSDTIIEGSLTNNVSTQVPAAVPIQFPWLTVIANASPTNDDENDAENDDINDDVIVEFDSELVESVEIQNNSDNTGASQLSQDQSNCSVRSLEKSKVKHLTAWSLNIMHIKSNEGNSISVITLTGVLLSEDQNSISKFAHMAGILEVRKTKHIVKTDNGLYHLIGPIAEGSPVSLYDACVKANGIPKTWRNILTSLSMEVEMNINERITRKGTIYSKNIKTGQKPSGSKAVLGHEKMDE